MTKALLECCKVLLLCGLQVGAVYMVLGIILWCMGAI